MATINFPASPVVGQLYQFGGNTWQCTSAGTPPVWNLVFSDIVGGLELMALNYWTIFTEDVMPNQPESFTSLTVTDLYVYINASTNNVNLYTLAGSPTVAINLHVVLGTSVLVDSTTA